MVKHNNNNQPKKQRKKETNPSINQSINQSKATKGYDNRL